MLLSVIVGILIIGSLSFVGQNSGHAGLDETAPVITCPGDITISQTDPTDPGFTGVATATDESPINSITFADQFLIGNPIILLRTWTAIDFWGNQSSCVQTITIPQDETAPVITCPPDLLLTPFDPTDPGFTGVATATDESPINSITFSDIVSAGNPVIITRTWTAIDFWGNQSSCLQTITIVLEVEIDIKPNSDPNSVNQKSKGRLPVAIFGSPEFDVTQIDTTTVDFDIFEVNGSTIATKCNIEDVNGDGIDDMICFFKIEDIEHKCTAEFVVGQIQGELLDGTPFRGFDDVRWVNCKHFDP
jgi:hypothetical protein